jgi:hypothetical protein
MEHLIEVQPFANDHVPPGRGTSMPCEQRRILQPQAFRCEFDLVEEPFLLFLPKSDLLLE